jgi:hypothetical protein
VVQEELAKEMKVFKQKVELIDLHHYRMEEFDNLKMEHAFMKAELLIYKKRSKRIQVEKWELYKEKIDEII